MNYNLLKHLLPKNQIRRVATNLAALRGQLDGSLPAKDSENHLLLATWNVRDLGKINRRGYGPRQPESHFYIAEILSRFDFVAVQEVNELDEWETVMDILGHHWDFVATDVTDTSLGGNGERLTFLFDRRKVTFRNIAGEIVLPPSKLITTNVTPKAQDKKLVAGKIGSEKVGRQFARSPYVASFQSAWFKFDICTVHIYYGDESGEKLQRRVEEIAGIAKYFGSRAKDARKGGVSLIVLGDFNIVDPEHQTMNALTSNGFKVPKALLGEASNIARDKHYDQIAFQTEPGVLEFIDGSKTHRRAGLVDIFEHLYTDDQFPAYKTAAKASGNGKKKTGKALEDYYRDWRTYQLSDHNPMWVQLAVNASGPYLDRIIATNSP
jgi:exonuclease III